MSQSKLHIPSPPQLRLLFRMLLLRSLLPFSRPLPARPRAPNLRLLCLMRRHKHRLHLSLFPPRHQTPQSRCRRRPPPSIPTPRRIRTQTNSRMQLRVKRAQLQRVPSRVPCPRSLLPPCRTLAQRSTMSTRHRTSAQYNLRHQHQAWLNSQRWLQDNHYLRRRNRQSLSRPTSTIR